MSQLISVMMPAWNAEAWIAEAIQSMIQQTHEDWELIIVDDGSTDATWDILNEVDCDRARMHRIPHSGCPAARNMALALCQGDVIARLDADDVHDPTRLEKQVALLSNHDLVTTGYGWIIDGKKYKRPSYPMVEATYLAGGPGPVCASIVAHKDVYELVGDFNEKLLAGSDAEWNFRALGYNLRWGYVPEMLYYQRRHEGQISQRLKHEQYATYKEALKHAQARARTIDY